MLTEQEKKDFATFLNGSPNRGARWLENPVKIRAAGSTKLGGYIVENEAGDPLSNVGTKEQCLEWCKISYCAPIPASWVNFDNFGYNPYYKMMDAMTIGKK